VTDPVRLAGWGPLGADITVTWTVSEGRRGRRWREAVARAHSVRHSLLLETDPSGRFAHVELASAAGLWTFHREGDGTLHGNHVDPSEPRVRHVAGWPFALEDLLLVVGSPIAAAATAWSMRSSVAPGQRVMRAAVRLDPTIGSTARVEAVEIERLDERRWRIETGEPFDVDDRGVPVLAGGVLEPLELA